MTDRLRTVAGWTWELLLLVVFLWAVLAGLLVRVTVEMWLVGWETAESWLG
jgi:hypothetical protein